MQESGASEERGLHYSGATEERCKKKTHSIVWGDVKGCAPDPLLPQLNSQCCVEFSGA